MEYGPNGLTGSFGSFVNFEIFKLLLSNGADNVTTGAGADTSPARTATTC